MLGSSECKVLSVLDLKGAFHSLRLLENLKKRYCGIHPYFVWHIISIQENAYGTKYFTFNMEIIHKCNIRLLAKYEIL